MLVKKDRLELTMNVDEWIDTSQRLPFFHFVPIDTATALQSVNLPGVFHEDSADSIIVTTAIKLNATVLSKGRSIRSYPHVVSIW